MGPEPQKGPEKQLKRALDVCVKSAYQSSAVITLEEYTNTLKHYGFDVQIPVEECLNKIKEKGATSKFEEDVCKKLHILTEIIVKSNIDVNSTEGKAFVEDLKYRIVVQAYALASRDELARKDVLIKNLESRLESAMKEVAHWKCIAQDYKEKYEALSGTRASIPEFKSLHRDVKLLLKDPSKGITTAEFLSCVGAAESTGKINNKKQITSKKVLGENGNIAKVLLGHPL